MSDIPFIDEESGPSHLQQMKNTDSEAVEMRELRAHSGNSAMGCSEACIAWHQQHQQYYPLTLKQQMEKDMREGPYDPIKTKFLITTIVIFVLWVIVYSILGSLNII